MPAYLREIPRPRCPTCGRPATVEAINHVNSTLGTYCRKDGTKLVADYNARMNRIEVGLPDLPESRGAADGPWPSLRRR